MHANESTQGTPGRPRAKRPQILAMARDVVRDEPKRIVIRQWSGTVSFWRPVTAELWECVESTQLSERQLNEEIGEALHKIGAEIVIPAGEAA